MSVVSPGQKAAGGGGYKIIPSWEPPVYYQGPSETFQESICT